MQDPFVRALANRRRAVCDLPWFGLAFVLAGLGSAITCWGEWPWMALSIVSGIAGVMLLVRWNHGRATRTLWPFLIDARVGGAAFVLARSGTKDKISTWGTA